MNKVEKKKSLFFLLFYTIKKYWKLAPLLFTSILAFEVFTSITDPIERIIIGKIIDKAVDILALDSVFKWKEVMLYPLLLILIGFILSIIRNIYTYVDQIYDLNSAVFNDKLMLSKYLSLDPQTYEDSNFIKLKNKIDWNLWKLTNNVFISNIVISQSLLIVSLLGILLQFNKTIILYVLLSQIPSVLITLKFGRRVWGIWDDNGEEKVLFNSYRRSLFSDHSEQFQEIKVLGYGKYLLDKAIGINTKFIKRFQKLEFNRTKVILISKIWEYGFLGAMIFTTFNLVLNKNISIGDFAVVFSTYNSLNGALNRLIYRLVSIQSDYSLLESFYNLMEYPSKIKSGKIKILKTNPVSIEFKDVWFKYPNSQNWILKGVTFKINSDEDVSFVGKNGAGKSTIIKLIMRMYDPTKGVILVNNRDLKEYSINDYHSIIGVLSQSFNKLDISLKENISVGDVKRKPTLKEIVLASKEGESDEFANKLTKKYDTYLTKEIEGGVLPSGGEWQRIAISRIFFRDPKLLILDEPTSAIDAIAEERIFENIKRYSENKTVIIVSHRFATVKKADRIIVIDKGMVLEEGNHEDLMKNKSLYFKMYTKQRKA